MVKRANTKKRTNKRRNTKRVAKRSITIRRSQRGGDGEGQLNNYQEKGNTIYKAVYHKNISNPPPNPPPKKSWWNKSWAEIKMEQNLEKYGPEREGLTVVAEGVDERNNLYNPRAAHHPLYSTKYTP